MGAVRQGATENALFLASPPSTALVPMTDVGEAWLAARQALRRGVSGV